MTELLSYPLDSGAEQHTAELVLAFDRLGSEHRALYGKIDDLQSAACRLQKTHELIARPDVLKQLKENTLLLLAELNDHSEWELTELFPLLTAYFQLSNRPDTATSLWMLEKDFELAAAYFRLFLNEAEQCCMHLEKNGEGGCLEQLLQACRLVKGHLQMEEETIFPLLAELPESIHRGIRRRF